MPRHNTKTKTRKVLAATLLGSALLGTMGASPSSTQNRTSALVRRVDGKSGDTFPSKPPADLPARATNLPTIESRTLPNGLKVVVAESHRVPLVTIRLAVLGGSILDPTDQPGLASAVASQLTAGTDQYNSLQLRQAAEKLGGNVGAGAGSDYASVTASALSENLVPLVDLMSDVVLHPAFPASEVATYQRLTLQGLVIQRQNPSFLASEQISKLLYGAHPYGVVSTTPVAVQAITPEKLQAFYKAHYTPQGATLVVVGDVQPKQVFEAVQKALSGWTGSSAAADTYPTPPVRDARRIYLINRPGSVQSNIVFGNLALKRGDPDAYALAVANNILGGGSASRLFSNVRERLGYAYDVRSSASAQALAGDFMESAQTQTKVTADALKEMLKEEDRLRTEPVSAQELQDAKSFISGNFALSLAAQASLADRLMGVEVYHLPADYLVTYRDKINAVTAADVQRVAQTYMHPDKSAIVVVGDADKLRDDLKTLGDVEEVK